MKKSFSEGVFEIKKEDIGEDFVICYSEHSTKGRAVTHVSGKNVDLLLFDGECAIIRQERIYVEDVLNIEPVEEHESEGFSVTVYELTYSEFKHIFNLANERAMERARKREEKKHNRRVSKESKKRAKNWRDLNE